MSNLQSKLMVGCAFLVFVVGGCGVSPELEGTAFGDAPAASGGMAGADPCRNANGGGTPASSGCPGTGGAGTTSEAGAAGSQSTGGTGGSSSGRGSNTEAGTDGGAARAQLGGAAGAGGSPNVGGSSTPGSAGDAGLVLYYNFDETGGSVAHDLGRSTNDGVVRGGASWVSAGKIGGGLHLAGGKPESLSEGQAQYVELPPAILNALQQTTIASWFRWEGGSDWQRLFDFGADADHAFFLTPRAYGDILLVLRPTSTTAKQLYLPIKQALPVNAWMHIAVTWSRAAMVLYLNGRMMATTPQESAPTPDGGPSEVLLTINSFIGRSQSGTDDYFAGTIDEFRIYDRVLNESEITALYEFRE